MDADLHRILDDAYLEDLAEIPVDELRRLRAECQHVETQLSFLRRLVQGRHDIVTGQLDRLRHGGDPDDVHDLVERLPDILSDRIRAPGARRLPPAMEPGEVTGALADRLAALAEKVPVEAPGAHSLEVLTASAADLSALEHEVSSLRRALFDRIDALQGEITRRYRDGEAQVDDLLHPDA